MTKTAKSIIWKLLNILRIGGPLQLFINSQIKDAGWFNSFISKESVDKNNQPIPWYTYSFIKFIETRLDKNFNVFEYGCGNSTFWLSARVSKIKSVEHNKEWFHKISKQLPSNAELVYQELDENKSYANEVAASNNKYDIIIVDGVDRNNCVFSSVSSLSENGIIIFDNSDRDEYSESIKYLNEKNFKRIDFWGLGPVTSINTCTSIFYRDNNCLGI